MATARDIVEDALRLAGVTSGSTPTASEADEALSDLNDMLGAWQIDGMDLGEGTLALSDTVGFPDAYLMGVKYNLALLLCEQYGQPIPQTVVAGAEAGRRNIRTALTALADLEFDRELTRGWLANEQYGTT